MQTAISYGHQARITHLLIDRPEWREYFERMVAWEESHDMQPEWAGWVWQNVNCSPSIINSLVAMSIVEMCNQSRSYTHYRLMSLADTKEALALDEPDAQRQPINVDALFSLVVGHDRVKQLLRYAVKADGAVHVLLVGQPGTAKTLLLSELGRLPGAEFYAGSTTTKSGLVGLLLEKHPPFLILDEIDKMEPRDMSPLLNLMETGTVTRLMHGVQARMDMETRLFAGANDVRKLPAPILSRFAMCEFQPYTDQEFLVVAREVLIHRYNQGPEMALHIAAEVVKKSTDIRDAVRVARMAKGDPRAVLDVVRCLWPKQAKGVVTPFRPR